MKVEELVITVTFPVGKALYDLIDVLNEEIDHLPEPSQARIRKRMERLSQKIGQNGLVVDKK